MVLEQWKILDRKAILKMKLDENIKCERCGCVYEARGNIWYSINNIKDETIAKIVCPNCGKVVLMEQLT